MACRSLIPMTVVQVKSCIHDDSIEGETHILHPIGNQEVDHVEMVGQVSQILREEPLVFFIDDGSGSLFCCRGPLEPDEEAFMVEVHQYVQLFGKVGYIPQKARGEPESHLYIDVFKVRPVVDFNLITNHMLRCMHTHLLMGGSQDEGKDD